MEGVHRGAAPHNGIPELVVANIDDYVEAKVRTAHDYAMHVAALGTKVSASLKR
jgi:hypothetical protein